MIGLTD